MRLEPGTAQVHTVSFLIVFQRVLYAENVDSGNGVFGSHNIKFALKSTKCWRRLHGNPDMVAEVKLNGDCSVCLRAKGSGKLELFAAQEQSRFGGFVFICEHKDDLSTQKRLTSRYLEA